MMRKRNGTPKGAKANMKAAKRLGLLLVLVLISGCGTSNPDTVSATGTVTYKGAPVEGATVVFGAASGQPSGAQGKTDASGKFSLTTFKEGDGAIPGKYSVVITKKTEVGGMTQEEEHAAVSAGKAAAEPKAENQLPAKYAAAERSGLTAEVTEGGANDFKFELTD
jgi:hypothetical protein